MAEDGSVGPPTGFSESSPSCDEDVGDVDSVGSVSSSSRASPAEPLMWPQPSTKNSNVTHGAHITHVPHADRALQVSSDVWVGFVRKEVMVQYLRSGAPTC